MKPIVFIFFFLSTFSVYSQHSESRIDIDTIHNKGNHCVGISFNTHGQIYEATSTVERSSWLITQVRVGGMYFLADRLAVGYGVNYFDYYRKVHLPGFKYDKPLVGELAFRYYPFKRKSFRKLYFGPELMYGAFCRNIDGPDFNKHILIGCFTGGLETKLYRRLYFEFEITTYSDITCTDCFSKFGRGGNGFLGLNYYFNR